VHGAFDARNASHRRGVESGGTLLSHNPTNQPARSSVNDTPRPHPAPDSQRCSVELAHLVNGEIISVRRLSPRAEWRMALAAAGVVLGLSAGASLVVALALLGAHRVVYGPGYVGLWALVALGAAVAASARARGRARRYTVGAGIDDDAFSSVPMWLVRRTSGGYRLTLTPGMTGRMEGVGRAPVLVESLVRDRGVSLPLGAGASAELSLGTTTFVARVLPDDAQPAPLPGGFARRFARRALMPLELAALASVLWAVPVGARLGEADMRSAIPAGATPWEIEKMLRLQAQRQAGSLHQCFDVAPVECQRQGYVGVGLSLSREGEIRSRWIARSTFGRECPVEPCMSDVIAGWFFEPLPESMRVVLPVQVLRTDKPLPLGTARAAANEARAEMRAKLVTTGPAPGAPPAPARNGLN
jgi:hypothetical protein